MKKFLVFSIALLLIISNSYSTKALSDDYDSGYEAGYEDGQVDGYDEGYEEGYKAGYSNGQGDGYIEGYEEGYGDYEYEGSPEFHGYARIEKEKPTQTTEYVENTKVANAYNYTFESETTTKKSLSDKINDFESKFQDVVVILFLILLSVFLVFSIFCKLKEQFHKK